MRILNNARCGRKERATVRTIHCPSVFDLLSAKQDETRKATHVTILPSIF